MLTHRLATPRFPERVIVLGARGFVARHLQAWCARHNVKCLAVGSDAVDLTDNKSSARLAQLLQPDDTIIMTSMLTPDKGRDYRALMSNLRMAETVCLALQHLVCRHFLYLSSDAVYDAHQIPLDEDSSREPIDLYALSHTAREMMLSSELETKKIPFCVLRPTSIYGPGDTHNSYGPNRFVRTALREGRIQLFGGGEERRSHVYIDDLIRLIGLVVEHCSAGTLNVAVRAAASFEDIANTVVRLVGKPVHIEHAPRKVPPVVHRTYLNSSVVKSFPGFDFTPLEEGLASFVSAEATATPLCL